MAIPIVLDCKARARARAAPQRGELVRFRAFVPGTGCPMCGKASRGGRKRELADLPALAREEEPVAGCVRAAEARPRRQAREDPVLPDRPVCEHRGLGVEDRVARARRCRRLLRHGDADPVEFAPPGRPRFKPLKMSQRRTVGPNPVSTPQAMFFDGILNVTNFVLWPSAEPLPAAATTSRTSARARRRTRRLCRKGCCPPEHALMARKKRSSRLRPKTPSRIRKKRRGSAKPPLSGAYGARPRRVRGLSRLRPLRRLGGGARGQSCDGRPAAVVGDAVYLVPLGCVAVGTLMLVRSRLVDVRPFRLGLAVTALGVLLVLGDAHGGYAGQAVEAAFSWLIGSTASSSWAFSHCSPASSCSPAPRSAPSFAARTARSEPCARGRHAKGLQPSAAEVIPLPTPAGPPPPLVDGAHDFPDITEPEAAEPSALVTFDEGPFEETQSSLFDASDAIATVYHLPDRGSCASRGRYPEPPRIRARGGRRARLCARELRRRRDRRRRLRRAARHALRAPARAGTKVAKVAALKVDLWYALATTEIRILAPIPGKQAVGVEVPNVSPNLVTLGDVFDDLPDSAPALGLAGRGHLG